MLLALGFSVHTTALDIDIHILVPHNQTGDGYRNAIAPMGDVLD